MSELEQIVHGCESLFAHGKSGVLGTIVRTSGSTYRRAGARILLGEDGWLAGSVSGGCLERDLLLKARWLARSGPVIVTYDSTSADDDTAFAFGLGCNGVVEILLEEVSVTRPGPVPFLRRALENQAGGVAATLLSEGRRGQRLFLCGDWMHSTIADAALRTRIEGELRDLHLETYRQKKPFVAEDLFFEYVRPPLELVVFGAGHDALPLVQLAKTVGFRVTVVCLRPPLLGTQRFQLADRVVTTPPVLGNHTAVVIMNHNFDEDVRALAAVLTADVPYVGILGSRARTERLFDKMTRLQIEITPRQLKRLHAPIGLDLGAEGPEQIALAIVAEVQSAIAGGSGRPLREVKSITAPPPAVHKAARVTVSP